ncbi:MAG: CxxC-x17-CxxC domain-containing protein [Nanoarchaeota archaeon]|mgnify:CR=1 FL=1
MGDFREDRGGGYRGNRSGGRSGGFGGRREGGRGRDSRSFERKRFELHTATCDKCKKQCEVPFRPTQGKPVYCSDCFRKDGDYGSSSSSSKSEFTPNRTTAPQSGGSSDQFNEINAKLDKILEILANVEFEEIEEDEDSEEDESGEEEK